MKYLPHQMLWLTVTWQSLIVTHACKSYSWQCFLFCLCPITFPTSCLHSPLRDTKYFHLPVFSILCLSKLVDGLVCLCAPDVIDYFILQICQAACWKTSTRGLGVHKSKAITQQNKQNSSPPCKWFHCFFFFPLLLLLCLSTHSGLTDR